MDRIVDKIVVQAPKAETPRQQDKETYRAPRLVRLGTAVGLVQGGVYGYSQDGSMGWYRDR
jgi:hypothetical protein